MRIVGIIGFSVIIFVCAGLFTRYKDVSVVSASESAAVVAPIPVQYIITEPVNTKFADLEFANGDGIVGMTVQNGVLVVSCESVEIAFSTIFRAVLETYGPKIGSEAYIKDFNSVEVRYN